jgi:hypothetical protein
MDINGVILRPQQVDFEKPESPIFDHMHQVWDPLFYEIPRKAIMIGTVPNPAEFSKEGPPEMNVNNMVVKLPASDKIYVPNALGQVVDTIQQIVDFEYAMDSKANEYYAYVTIRQGLVKARRTQSHPSIHADGIQGAKYTKKLLPGHSYFVADAVPTKFFYQSFTFAGYSVGEYDYRTLMGLQAQDEKAYLIDQPYGIYLIDAYMVHQPTVAIQDTFRTFLRVQFTQKQFVKSDDLDNPMLTYKTTKEGPNTIPTHLKMRLLRDVDGLRYYLDDNGERIHVPAAEDNPDQRCLLTRDVP